MNYSIFKTEDFLLDPSFVQWARDGENDEFWQTFLIQNPSKADDVERARLLIHAAKSLPVFSLSAESQDSLWERVQQKIADETEPYSNPVPLLRRIWWVAASILMIAGWLGWQTMHREKLTSVTYEKLIAGTEAKKDYLVEYINNTNKVMPVSLPDGSSILLKSKSRIGYFKDRFGVTKREVYISGEAFFEVARNPEKPFFVYANELITKVLGTSFTIKAYPDDKQVNVSVKTGKVSVFTQFETKKNSELNGCELSGVVLTPNQHITLNRQELRLSRILIRQPELGPTIEQEPLQAFEFDDVPVSDIFEKIEKAYGVEIVYDEELLAKCRITASLTKEPLYKKIRLICEGLGASYEMIDARIVIQSNGCK